jgi:hypothetical protein
MQTIFLLRLVNWWRNKLVPTDATLGKEPPMQHKECLQAVSSVSEVSTRMQEISSSYGLFNEQVFYFFCSQHQDKINSEFLKYFQTTTKYR